MTITTEHSAKHVNALSIGVQEGRSGSPTVQAANSSLVNYYAASGYSVYFPPGQYEFSSVLSWTGLSDVKVWGDLASLYQVSNVRLLDISNCDSVEVSGLHLHTQYFDNRAAAGGGTDETAISVDGCNEINIHDNICEGFNTYVVWVRGGRNIIVKDNQFKDGHWTNVSGQIETADIRLDRNGSNVANQITITGNQCNTKSLLGISCQQPSRKVICCNNNVVSLDASGNEVTAYDAVGRKAGIELQYYTDAATGGLTATDDTKYEMIINDNIVQGARYGGISCQDFGTSVHSGIRGTIANNLIRYCGHDTDGTITSNVQGGIIVNQYRDLVISGNVIKDIPDDGGLNGVSCIICEQTLERVAGATGTLTSLKITDNIISDSAARGIYCEDTGDTLIANNTIQDIDGRQYIHVSVSSGKERSGHVIVEGNKLAGETDVVVDIIRIENGGNEADFIVANNFLNFESATWSGTFAALLLYGVRMTVVGNRCFGNGGSSVGLDFGTSQTLRMKQCIVADNNFEGFNEGIVANLATDRGPFIVANTTCTNCTTDLATANIYPGYWANEQAVVHSTAAPTHGDFELGDQCWNIAPSSGNPMGWYCSVAGTPGTWTAMSNNP